MIQLATDLKLPQGLVIAIVWSIMLIGLGTYLGATIIDVDCETCEASLEDAIEELHTCQQKLLIPEAGRCEDDRLTERKRCQSTLAEYKRLRCKICEISDDIPSQLNVDDKPDREPSGI